MGADRGGLYDDGTDLVGSIVNRAWNVHRRVLYLTGNAVKLKLKFVTQITAVDGRAVLLAKDENNDQWEIEIPGDVAKQLAAGINAASDDLTSRAITGMSPVAHVKKIRVGVSEEGNCRLVFQFQPAGKITMSLAADLAAEVATDLAEAAKEARGQQSHRPN